VEKFERAKAARANSKYAQRDNLSIVKKRIKIKAHFTFLPSSTLHIPSSYVAIAICCYIGVRRCVVLIVVVSRVAQIEIGILLGDQRFHIQLMTGLFAHFT
jgi:hypothetical protein